MDKRAERILKRNNNPGGEIAKLSDIVTFKLDFWMVSVVCVAYYVAIFPFVALGQAFMLSHRPYRMPRVMFCGRCTTHLEKGPIVCGNRS